MPSFIDRLPAASLFAALFARSLPNPMLTSSPLSTMSVELPTRLLPLALTASDLLPHAAVASTACFFVFAIVLYSLIPKAVVH
jgi:hypothetical protein